MIIMNIMVFFYRCMTTSWEMLPCSTDGLDRINDRYEISLPKSILELRLK